MADDSADRGFTHTDFELNGNWPPDSGWACQYHPLITTVVPADSATPILVTAGTQLPVLPSLALPWYNGTITSSTSLIASVD